MSALDAVILNEVKKVQKKQDAADTGSIVGDIKLLPNLGGYPDEVKIGTTTWLKSGVLETDTNKFDKADWQYEQLTPTVHNAPPEIDEKWLTPVPPVPDSNKTEFDVQWDDESGDAVWAVRKGLSAGPGVNKYWYYNSATDTWNYKTDYDAGLGAISSWRTTLLDLSDSGGYVLMSADRGLSYARISTGLGGRITDVVHTATHVVACNGVARSLALMSKTDHAFSPQTLTVDGSGLAPTSLYYCETFSRLYLIDASKGVYYTDDLGVTLVKCTGITTVSNATIAWGAKWVSSDTSVMFTRGGSLFRSEDGVNFVEESNPITGARDLPPFHFQLLAAKDNIVMCNSSSNAWISFDGGKTKYETEDKLSLPTTTERFNYSRIYPKLVLTGNYFMKQQAKRVERASRYAWLAGFSRPTTIGNINTTYVYVRIK